MRTATTSILTLTALVCLALPLTAAKAEVISKTRYKRHAVHGTTPASRRCVHGTLSDSPTRPAKW